MQALVNGFPVLVNGFPALVQARFVYAVTELQLAGLFGKRFPPTQTYGTSKTVKTRF